MSEEGVLDRLKALQTNLKGLKAGKGDAAIVAIVQEAIGFLGVVTVAEAVSLTCRVLDDASALTAQAGTVIRLEGGLKLLLKHLRAFYAVPSIAGPTARILARACATSQLTLASLAKEKGLGALLISCCAMHAKEPSTAGPLCEAMAHIAKSAKGAAQLAVEPLLPLLRELLVVYLGHWAVCGWVLKLAKNMAKHEGAPRGALTRGGEGQRLLLGVARLLARMPEQKKLLKRTSRALWLLCSPLLLPLPELEPLVALPPKDHPNLTIPSAFEADASRHQELFPEEYSPQVASPPCPRSGPPQLVRPAGGLPVPPPSARQISWQYNNQMGRVPEPFHGYGSSLDCQMMLHDLERIVNAQSLINKLVYFNTPYQPADAALQQQQGNPHLASFAQLSLGTGDAAPFEAQLQQRLAASAAAPAAQQGAGSAAPSRSSSSQLPAVASCSGCSNGASALPSVNGAANGPGPGPAGADGTAVPAPVVPVGGGPGPGPPPPPLSFQSCYESGNLRAAVQVTHHEYDLFLASDLNDRAEGGNLCQWFYFAVVVGQPHHHHGLRHHQSAGAAIAAAAAGVLAQAPLPGAAPNASPRAAAAAERPASAEGAGTSAGAAGGGGEGPPWTYKFNLVNFRKKQSLFSAGKRPLVCMMRRPDSSGAAAGSGPAAAQAQAQAPRGGLAAAAGGGASSASGCVDGQWVRTGANICYYPSPYRGRPTATSGDGPSGKKGKKAPAGGGKKGGSGKGAASGSGAKPAAKGAAAAASAAPASSEAEELGASGPGPGLYCCTFTLQLDAPGTYYIASCYPYTYTDLQEHLDQLQRRLLAEQVAAGGPAAAPLPLVRSLLCTSLWGLRCELLTITDWSAPLELLRQRECIVITARVHPGETCASWIMQGIVDFLVSPDPVAATLRSSFVFKLVPMLNPDGVVNGNYRCSLGGVDLNRMWEKPQRWLHPTVHHTKRMLQQLAAAGRLALYLDIHGHSTKSDTFFYGCEPGSIAPAGSKQDLQQQAAAAAAAVQQQQSQQPGGALPAAQGLPQAPSPYPQAGAGGAPGAAPSAADPAAARAGLTARVAARLRVRMLPFLTAKISTDFNLAQCNYKVRKAKLGAARVVVNREMGVAGSYTMEASLAGQSTTHCHYSVRDYLNLGQNLCRAISELAEVDDQALLEDMHAKITLPS